MTPRPIPPAPEWYRLALDDGLDGADRFMFGPAPAMPADVVALAYRIGVMPGTRIRASRVAWQLPVLRRPGPYGEPREAYAIDVVFAVRDMAGPGRAAFLEHLAAAVLERAGEPARVRELLEHAEYLAGRAVVRYVEAGRGWCMARVDRFGRRIVRVEVAGDEHREPADLDALAEIVPVIELASARAERWRERGDDS